MTTPHQLTITDDDSLAIDVAGLGGGWITITSGDCTWRITRRRAAALGHTLTCLTQPPAPPPPEPEPRNPWTLIHAGAFATGHIILGGIIGYVLAGANNLPTYDTMAISASAMAAAVTAVLVAAAHRDEKKPWSAFSIAVTIVFAVLSITLGTAASAFPPGFEAMALTLFSAVTAYAVATSITIACWPQITAAASHVASWLRRRIRPSSQT